jgi:hypothetical protein
VLTLSPFPLIFSYPCGWSSYSEQIAYHLDIALESDGPEPGSGGYTYQQMMETWLAANHTKSHIAMMWWSPDTLYQSFVRTDAEFTRIMLPPPTEACDEARVSTQDRCSLNITKRVGAAVGACDENSKPLYKVVTSSLYDWTFNKGVPVARISPAYDTVKLFQISGSQLGEVMTMAINSNSPREGVCQWVVENMDYMLHAIPQTYPRVLQMGNQSNGLHLASSIYSILVTILCLVSLLTVFRQRHRRVMVFAQVEFMYLILVGLLAVSLGALLSLIPPSQVSCIPIIWLINLGYTLELVPLIAKVSAINRLLNAAAPMKRVVVRRKSMYGGVIGISVLVCIFLLAWTLIDPPVKDEEYKLTNTVHDGATLVIATPYCTSERSLWMIASLAWRAILLVSATVLAFQNRNARQDFNESRTLGLMIYSQFIFVVLRIIMYFFLPDVINEATLRLWFSILYSTDTITTILIYFVPKFVAADETTQRNTLSVHREAALPSTESDHYHDRRMRSEMMDSEFVRDEASKELNDVVLGKSENDDDCECSPVPEKPRSGSNHEKQVSGSKEFGLRRRKVCVHCGQDPDTADTSDDSSSSPAQTSLGDASE